MSKYASTTLAVDETCEVEWTMGNVNVLTIHVGDDAETSIIVRDEATAHRLYCAAGQMLHAMEAARHDAEQGHDVGEGNYVRRIRL